MINDLMILSLILAAIFYGIYQAVWESGRNFYGIFKFLSGACIAVLVYLVILGMLSGGGEYLPEWLKGPGIIDYLENI